MLSSISKLEECGFLSRISILRSMESSATIGDEIGKKSISSGVNLSVLAERRGHEHYSLFKCLEANPDRFDEEPRLIISNRGTFKIRE